MLESVDLDRSPIAIYREWLGSLPAARPMQPSGGRYVVAAWLDEVNNPTVAVRPWLDEVGNPTATRRWLDEINNPSPATRPWLDEIGNLTATRQWLDEINNPTPATARRPGASAPATTMNWRDEFVPPTNTPPTNARPRADGAPANVMNWRDEFVPPTNTPPTNARPRADGAPANVMNWRDEFVPPTNTPPTNARPRADGAPANVMNWRDEFVPPTAVRPWLDEINNPRLASPTSVARQPAGVVTRGGANEVGINTPQGRVRVWLPDDAAAGDTVSGTVVAEPTGRDQTQRRANSDTLEGYVVDVGGQRTPVSGGRFTFTVPRDATRLAIGLVDGSRRVGETGVNVAPPAGPGPQRMVIPNVGQAGRPLEIPGAFDGNAANTTVNVGPRPAEVIAESPRQATIWTPSEPASNSTIAVTENGRTTQAPYRNIRIELSSPRTNLQRGEQTQVQIRVLGLEGITQPVGVRIEASSSVQMAGGNVQTLSIAPSTVGPGGVFQTDRQVQATQSGPFTITGTLVTPGGPP